MVINREVAGRWRPGPAAVPLLFLGALYVYPMLVLVQRAISTPPSFAGNTLRTSLAAAHVGSAVWFSIWEAAVSTALTLLIALPLAYASARIPSIFTKVATALTTAAFILPTAVVASAFSAVLRSDGWLGRLHLNNTIWAVLMAHVFFNTAIVVRVVGTAWRHVDTRGMEAARTLGATGHRAFRAVALPVLLPALRSAAALIFIFSFTSFAVVLLLGGKRETVEVAIYRQVTQVLDLHTAIALSLLQLVVLGVVVRIATSAARSAILVRAPRPAQFFPSRRRQALMIAAALPAVVIVLLPLLALIQKSLSTRHGYSLDNFRHLLDTPTTSLVSPVTALWNSLFMAAVAALLATTIGTFAAVSAARSKRWGRIFDVVLALPLATSGVIIGLAYLLAFATSPLDFRTSFWMVPLAQAAIGIPFVLRTVAPSFRAIPPALRDAAATSGASPLRVWVHVDLPLAAKGIAAGCTLAFAIALGDFGATSLVARADRPTLPLVVASLLGRPNTAAYGQAMAASVTLLTVIALLVVVLARLERD